MEENYKELRKELKRFYRGSFFTRYTKKRRMAWKILADKFKKLGGMEDGECLYLYFKIVKRIYPLRYILTIKPILDYILVERMYNYNILSLKKTEEV